MSDIWSNIILEFFVKVVFVVVVLFYFIFLGGVMRITFKSADSVKQIVLHNVGGPHPMS